MDDCVINQNRSCPGIPVQKSLPVHSRSRHKPVEIIRCPVGSVLLPVNPVQPLYIFQGWRRHCLLLIFRFHVAKMPVWGGVLKDRIYILTAMTPAL